MISKRRVITHIASVTLLLLSWPVFALQTISVVNNASVSATISDKDFNKLFIQGDRIVNVMGTPNAYIIQTDNILGQLYIKPLQTQPFTLNISTEQGHAYQITLHINHGSTETIALQPPVTTPLQATNWESATPYEDTLVRLIRAMATGSFPDGYNVIATKDNIPLPLGNVATVTKISTYQGINLNGEIYIITNLTNQPLHLQPRQLYRTGTMAIALQTQAIAPHGQTRLFMVTAGAAHA